MSWEDVLAHSAEKNKLAEWRGRITKDQKETLEAIERDYSIPQAAIVRLALKTFLPTLEKRGYKMEGIKRVWDESKF